ncbi:MAG TPA: 6-phosphogluconolactonase [Actinomycetota bacterium]|nr:6-phosphogluconolactonase [Actinomycetota bacterium]
MELVVDADPAAAGVRLFVEVAPRTLVLAGGSTPRELYRRLAALPYPWREVEVFFGDERCVPPDHPDSNLRMARETLLTRVPARVHPMTGCRPEDYERELRAVFGDDLPRFDLAFLGLGEDGHTASLFPGDPALEAGDRWVALVERPDHRRMTLTLPVLSAARVAAFLVAGPGKREALARLLRGDPGIPAARVGAERVVVVADPAAAGRPDGPAGRG